MENTALKIHTKESKFGVRRTKYKGMLIFRPDHDIIHKNDKAKRLGKQCALTVLGAMLIAAGMNLFYSPNKIVSGGVSRIAIIIHYAGNVPISVSLAAINVLLLIRTAMVFGRKYILKTVFGTVSLIAFTELFSHLPPITNNLFLATVFGGVLDGAGSGLILAYGMNTGGNDLVARLIQHHKKHLKVGKVMLVTDLAVVSASYFVFRQAELILYGILLLVITTFIIDYVINRLNLSVFAFVITGKGYEIRKILKKNFPRGFTILNCRGGSGLKEKQLILCALKQKEAPDFRKVVREADRNSFVIFSEAKKIYGYGFVAYK